MISRRFRATIVTGFALLFACSAAAAQARVRVPVVPAGAVDLGPVPAAAPVSVRLYLAPDAAHVAALDQLIADQQDVTSAEYHHWLTPVEFGARFGANVAQVRTFAENQGLGVDVAASGLRVTVSGTAAQIEQAFSPGLHAYVVGGKQAMANTAVPVLPQALVASVMAVGGLDTLTSHAVVSGAATTATDLPGQLGDVVDANASRVVAFTSTACASDISAADQAAFELEAKQAAVQGITVLATDGCGVAGSSSFPAALSEVTAVAVAPGLASGEAADAARPAWQWAPGLPGNALRYAPDVTASDVNALMQTLLGIAASMPVVADGSVARLGNVNATLYAMGPMPGVFTQADGAAAGTWEPATGLGLVNLAALARAFPRGSFSVYVSGSASNYAPTHGQSTTLISSVSDTSGQGGGAVPTGTITFTLATTGGVLGTVPLVNGTASLPISTLPGGSIEVLVSYSGDANYLPGQNSGIYLSVQPEPAVLTANPAVSTALGGTISIAVTAMSGSGVGTPVGSATALPQGIPDQKTYSAPLNGSGGTSTATVMVPASQAGTITLLVNCVSTDPSFSCYSPIRTTAVVRQAASALSFTVSPNPPVTGTTTTFVGTVANAAAPAPAASGSVNFYDNGNYLGTGTLGNGTATYTNSSLTSGGTHAFMASYSGDVNYQASNASGPSVVAPVATTTALNVSPNPPVNGSPTTLTATLGYISTGTAATGTVQFYEDSTLIGSGAVNAAGVATLMSSAISGTAAHSFTASYLGDSVYAGSQSAAFTTQANTATVTTTTSVSISSSTVNTGGSVTLTGTVVPTSTLSTAPTGTVSFTSSLQGALGTATLSGTTAPLTVALTTAGMQSITATYSGDANYKASTSTTPAVVTVGTATTPVTLTVNPSTGVMYSNPVTATVSVSGVATTNGAGPAGSVVFSVASAGTAATMSTVAITSSSTTAGAASYTFAAPAPGTYTVTASCTGTNFTCTTTPATASLVTVKGNTTTTVTAAPMGVIAGQTTTLTATIAAASSLAMSSTFTGTVTFYNAGGTALGMGTVAGNQATLTTSFTAATGNVITAVYSGDADWNASTSPTLSLVAAVSPTTATLTANYRSALQGSNVIFTVNVSDAPSTSVPTPGTPTGTVMFYDLYNGQSTLLGSATLIATGPYQATGQLSTTGLFEGTHMVTAVYAGTAAFGPATSPELTVDITDYAISFGPATLALSPGASGSATATITALNGFAGTVALSCTAPADTLTTCGFSPASVSPGGVAILTVGTTAAHAVSTQRAGLGGLGLGASLAAVLGCMVFPRRRRPALLALIALCGLLGAAGCGNGGNVGTGTTGGGSPLGTQLFTIVTAGSDGVTTNRHDVQFQVTIQ